MTATTKPKTRRHLKPNPGGKVQHKLARRPKARTKDSVVALDMFSGCGGSSQGIEAAGVDVWYAANHWEYAVEIHEANHPGAEHFIADLVDTDATDYYHPEHLPACDLLWASPSCTNHSKANAERAYRRNLSLFDIGDDADYDDNVTASERSRATAVSVLQYARKHRPKVIAVENVVEFAQWGVKIDSARKGDGSTFRWWLGEFEKLGYRTRVLFLNSMFFPPCPQSRDRMYVAMWHKSLPDPDLDHRPIGKCGRCDEVVETRQTFKHRRSTWPLNEWGKYGDQYVYTCPSCGQRVEPFALPALTALDLTDLGGRIGDRDKPLAPGTMARLARGVDKFGVWPPFLMPAKSTHGIERSSLRPMVTQTTQQELMLVHGFQAVVAGNTFERPGSTCRVRGLDEPLWSQHTTPAFGIVTAPPMFIDDYQGRATSVGEPLSTQLTSETHALVAMPLVHTARGSHEDRAAALSSVIDPLTVVTAGGNHHFLLTPLFAKQNGGPADTAWHQITERMNTLCTADTTCLLSPPSGELPPIAVEDCHYRMLKPGEIQLGMGIDPGFEMWGSARHRIKALGNAVTPPVSKWLVERLAALLR